MTKYKTGNPVGSADPRDLYDNAQVFDEQVNNVNDPTVLDRLGRARITLANQLGYNLKGDYAAGIEINSYNDIIRYGGEFYGPAASASLPYTTTATLPDSDSNLVARGDLVLRQDLALDPADGFGAALVKGAAVEVASIAALKAMNGANVKNALMTGDRAGSFAFKPSDNSAKVTNDPQNIVWVAPDSDPTGASGAWMRQYDSISSGGGINILWAGADLSDPAATRAAIQAAINFASYRGGMKVSVPAGDWKYDDQIVIKDGVHLEGAGGDGERGFCILRYTGTVFQDAITNAGESGDNTQIRNLTLFGGEFQQGRARYVLRLPEFHKFCVIENVLIRDGFGLIRIDSGYYCKITDLELRNPTPSQTSAGGISDAEWGEVYGSDDGPIYFGEMNGCTIDGLVVLRPTSEAVTGIEPNRAVYVDGEGCEVRAMTFERVGTEYTSGATYTPTVKIGIWCTGYVNFSNFYLEDCKFAEYLFLAEEDSCLTITGGSYILDLKAQTAFYNRGLMDLRVSDCIVRGADVERAWFALQSGLGEGGSVLFDNVTWRSGTNNADYDTFGQTNLYGAVDGTYNRFQNRYKNFPRKITGLEVSIGSDGSGAWVDIEGGVFLAQNGLYINSKMHTSDPSSGSIAPQRLRPDVASVYWRVWVGRAGNLYITNEGASAPTDPLGDWIAQFRTDSSGDPFDLAPNPRLDYRASFITGTTRAIIDGASATPPAGSSAWKDGDEVRNTDAVTGNPIGWRRKSGAWVSMGNYG